MKTKQEKNKNLPIPLREKSLDFVNPEVSKEWDYEANYPLTPRDVFANSHKNLWWKCLKCGNKYKWLISEKNCGHGLCLKCRSLGMLYPEIAKEWDCEANNPLTPFDVLAKSHKKVWWIGGNLRGKQCNHRWLMAISDRTGGGQNCPYCSNKKVCKDNCLAILNPKLAKEWHPTKNGKLTPLNIIAGSSIKAWWLCINNHEFFRTIDYMNRNKWYCPYCNSLKLKFPNLAKEWHPTKNGKLTSWDVTYCSKKKVWWKCSICGNEWIATISNRMTNGTNCPCHHKIILKGNIICDSIIEAYYYLKYKKENKKFRHNKVYPKVNGKKLGKKQGSRYDFYLIDENKYIEVTSFDEKWKGWQGYKKTINKKKRFVEKTLIADFEFIQFKPKREHFKIVRENMSLNQCANGTDLLGKI